MKNTVILQLNYKMSMQQSNYIIEVKGVSKFFGDKMVLDNINLYVKKGEFVLCWGPPVAERQLFYV